MNVICPKCKKEGKFNYFDAPDYSSVIAMVSHKTGKYEEITDCLGHKRKVEIIERHYLKQSDLDATDWFKKWKKQRDIELEKLVKEQRRKMDKLCEEDYWKEVENSRFKKR